MSLDGTISQAAYRPQEVLKGCIRIKTSASLAKLPRQSPLSSLGLLDTLPAELIDLICSWMDLRSLSRLSRTCLRGISLINSLADYRLVMRHAPDALAALGKTGIITHFSPADLAETLRSWACTSCGFYGQFLFLPTCQRHCFYCLFLNASLWVIPKSKAKVYFRISDAALEKAPVLHTLPGKYSVRRSITSTSREEVVCVGTVKHLAIAENPSQDHMVPRPAHFPRQTTRAGARHDEEIFWLCFQQAPLTPPSFDILARAPMLDFPADDFSGMASILFPYLSPLGQLQHGFWCRGCESTGVTTDAIPPHLRRILPPDFRREMALFSMQYLGRTREDFLKHVEECPRTSELVKYSLRRM